MFCRNCGSQLADDAKFCNACGQAVAAPEAPVAEPAAPVAVPMTNPMNLMPAEGEAVAAVNKTNKKTLTIIVAAAAALVAILLCVFLLGGDSLQDILDDNVNALLEGDISDLEDLAPDCAWVRLLAKKGVSIEQLTEAEYYEAAAKAYAKTITSVGGEEMSYEIISEITATPKYQSEVAEELVDRYGKYGLMQKDIGEVKILQVRLAGSAFAARDDIREMYAVEIDGDWYILSDEDTFMAYETAELIIDVSRDSDILEDLLN